MDYSLRESLAAGRSVVVPAPKDAQSVSVLQDCFMHAGVLSEPEDFFIGESPLVAGAKIFPFDGKIYAVGYRFTAGTIQIMNINAEGVTFGHTNLLSNLQNPATDGEMSFARFEKGVLITWSKTCDMWWLSATTNLSANPVVPPEYLGQVASYVGNFRERLVLGGIHSTLVTTFSSALKADFMAPYVEGDENEEAPIPAAWALLENPSRTIMWGGWLEDLLGCLLEPSSHDLHNLVKSTDWGWQKVPHIVTGLHCLYNSIVVTSARGVWRMTPLTELPSFALAQITNFGVLCSGSNASTVAFMALDGRTYLLYDDGKLEQLSDRDDTEYGNDVILTEQTGELWWCGDDGTLVRARGNWYTRSNIVHAYGYRYGGDVILGITVSPTPKFVTEVLSLGTTQMKNIRSVRISGTGVTGVRMHFTQDNRGLWGRTSVQTPDQLGVCVFNVSCQEFKLEFSGSNLLVTDIVLDYDITPKANFGRASRRI